MIATLVLAAVLPLGLWPVDAGAAATVIDDVEFYLVEPDEDYYILAVQPLPAPLATPEPAAVKRLAALALRLGAHAVLLLSELDEAAIPDDLDEPLQPGDRFVAAVFISFDTADDEPSGPTLTTLRRGGLATSPRRRSESGAFTPPRRRPCRVAGALLLPKVCALCDDFRR